MPTSTGVGTTPERGVDMAIKLTKKEALWRCLKHAALMSDRCNLMADSSMPPDMAQISRTLRSAMAIMDGAGPSCVDKQTRVLISDGRGLATAWRRED